MSTSQTSPTLPSGLRLDRTDRGLIITVSWRNMASWALVPLGLVTAAIPVLLVLKLRDLEWNHPLQLMPAVFGVFGAGFVFVVVRRLVNKTRIEVTPDRIRISHGPLPWRRPLEVVAESIRQLEVRPYYSRHEGVGAVSYHLWAVQRDGRETCLLERDATAEQSGYSRDEIQRVLDAGPAGQTSQSAAR
jgi:hypothetical protein